MELQELATVCDLQNGYAFRSGDYVDQSNTVSLRMSNIRPGGNFDNNYNLRYLPDSFQETYANYLIEDGDLVIAMTDLAGDPKILGVPTIVETGNNKWLLNQRAGKLIILDGLKTDKNYLRYILNHPIHKSYYKKFAGGGLQINVSKSNILGCKIPLPPIKTQQRIAKILDDAADLRDKTAELLKEYDLLAQSIFLDMFGDFSKYEYHPIKSVSNFIDYRGKTPFRVDKGIPLIGAKCVRQGYFDESKLDFIEESSYEKRMVRGFPKPGDVLFTTEGATLGFTCRIPNIFTKFSIGQRIITLQAKSNANNIFIEYILRSVKVQGEIYQKATGSAAKGIRSATFAKIEIPIPPIELQNEFAEKIAIIEQQKTLAKQELQESEDLFNCLLQNAFKGEL